MKNEFENWYAAPVCGKLKNGLADIKEVKVDLSQSRMKPLGAKLIVKLYNYLRSKPDIIKNGFKEARISSI